MVLNEIARTGSFDLTPSLKKKYKGHRESLRVKMGTASDSKTRARSSLGVGGEALSSCGACTRWMWPAWTSTKPPEEATCSGDLEVEGELEEAQAAAVRNRARAAFASALAGSPEDAAELGTGKPFPGSTKKPLGLAKRPMSLTKSTRPPRPGPLRPLVQTRAWGMGWRCLAPPPGPFRFFVFPSDRLFWFLVGVNGFFCFVISLEPRAHLQRKPEVPH